jgi:hypothetical protein
MRIGTGTKAPSGSIAVTFFPALTAAFTSSMPKNDNPASFVTLTPPTTCVHWKFPDMRVLTELSDDNLLSLLPKVFRAGRFWTMDLNLANVKRLKKSD